LIRLVENAAKVLSFIDDPDSKYYKQSTTNFMKQIQRWTYSIFCTAIFAFAIQAQAAPESGKVTIAVGDVKVTPKGGEAAAVKVGDTIAVGSTIKTGADSRVVVVITPRSAIRVAADSEVVIETVDENASPKDVLIDVKDGGVGALLKPNASSELDFKIRTPSGVAAARGTFYAVVVEDGKGYAQVKEGRVEIIPAAKADGNQ